MKSILLIKSHTEFLAENATDSSRSESASPKGGYILHAVVENQISVQARVRQFLKLFAFLDYNFRNPKTAQEHWKNLFERIRIEHMVSLHRLPKDTLHIPEVISHRSHGTDDIIFQLPLQNHLWLLCMRRPYKRDLDYCLLKSFNCKGIFFLIRNVFFVSFFTWFSRLLSKTKQKKIIRGRDLLENTSSQPPPLSSKTPQVLILVDPTQPEIYSNYLRSIKPLFYHFGVNHAELHKAEWEGKTFPLPSSVQILFIAHAGILNKLSDIQIQTLEDRIRQGMGLINLDFQSFQKKHDLAHRFGIQLMHPHVQIKEFFFLPVSKILQIPSPQRFKIEIPVDAYPFQITNHLPTVSILKHDSYELINIQTLDRGKICHFFVSSLVWDETSPTVHPIMVHLFRQLLIDCASKLLVLKFCPSYLFIKLDDVTLEHSLPQIEACVRQGVPIALGLFLYDIFYEDIQRLKELMQKYPGMITLSPHAGGWKHSFWYDALRKIPLTENQQITYANEIQSFFEYYNLPISPVLNPHFYEMGHESLVLIKSLGIRYTMMSFSKRPGNESKTSTESRLMTSPSYTYGYIGEELHNFCAEDYNQLRYLARNLWDWLRGCTSVKGTGLSTNAISRGIQTLLKAYFRGFPGVLSTHEYRLVRFSSEQIENILHHIKSGISTFGFTPIPAIDEKVSSCIKNIEDTCICRVQNRGRDTEVELHGRNDSPFPINIYIHEPESQCLSFLVPPFTHRFVATVPLPKQGNHFFQSVSQT